jgi:hypothetical protein
MIKATLASVVNLALDPLNPEKTSDLDDGGGNHRK